MHTKILSLMLLLCVSFGACKKEPLQYSYTGEIYRDHATDIILALQKIEQRSNGLWQRCEWWNSANVLEAVLDFHRQSEVSYAARCAEIYSKNQYHNRAGFKNRSYDDNAWWALAFIKAYDLYGDVNYLQTAEDVFYDMVLGGWDNKCGGGIVWQSNERYKNAITNELFIVLGAKLAQRQAQPWRKIYYLDWSLRCWKWLESSGIRNSQNLYNDGLNQDCTNNQQTTWTYNQGVILGGLKELYLLTGDETLLQSARETAFAAMQYLSDTNGILTEPCDGACGSSGIQFKGIFVRYLSELNQILKDKDIKQFILHNADTAWQKAQNGSALFDEKWQGPYQDWQGATTGVALDLMNAAQSQIHI